MWQIWWVTMNVATLEDKVETEEEADELIELYQSYIDEREAQVVTYQKRFAAEQLTFSFMEVEDEEE